MLYIIYITIQTYYKGYIQLFCRIFHTEIIFLNYLQMENKKKEVGVIIKKRNCFKRFSHHFLSL